MKQRTEIDLELASSLVQTALLAIWERDYAQAEIILDGISIGYPDLVQIQYVYTLLYQALGQVDKSIDLLRRTTHQQPHNDMAKSLLGFMLHQDQRSGWRELLQQVIANDADAAAIGLAEQLLQGEPQAKLAPSASAMGFPLDMIKA